MHSGNNRVRKKVYREFAIKIIIMTDKVWQISIAQGRFLQETKINN